jgi:glycine betaine/proline transport system permease protein
MTAVRLGTTTTMTPQRARRALFVVLAGAAFLTFLIFRDQWTLPHDDDSPLFRSLNGVRDFVDQNRTILEPIRATVTAIIAFFDELIASLGWPGIIGVAAALGMVFSGWRVTAIVVVGFVALGAIGLWDASMATLSLILAAVVIAIVVFVVLLKTGLL